jgi:hypothetical protein
MEQEIKFYFKYYFDFFIINVNLWDILIFFFDKCLTIWIFFYYLRFFFNYF